MTPVANTMKEQSIRISAILRLFNRFLIWFMLILLLVFGQLQYLPALLFFVIEHQQLARHLLC
jgi:hypothetical protein